MKRTTTPVHCAFLARFLHAIQFVRYDTFLARYATFFVYFIVCMLLYDTKFFLSMIFYVLKHQDHIKFKAFNR